MNAKPDDMEVTSMRVRRRTIRYIEYIKGLLKLRTGQDYSIDDVVWEALNIAYKSEIDHVHQIVGENEDSSPT